MKKEILLMEYVRCPSEDEIEDFKKKSSLDPLKHKFNATSNLKDSMMEDYQKLQPLQPWCNMSNISLETDPDLLDEVFSTLNLELDIIALNLEIDIVKLQLQNMYKDQGEVNIEVSEVSDGFIASVESKDYIEGLKRLPENIKNIESNENNEENDATPRTK